MRLRPRRRNLMVWSPSAGPCGRYGASRATRPAHGRRVRRWVRLGALLTLIGLVRLVRAGLAHWRLSAGVALTAVGVMLRGGAGSAVYFPGVLLLLSALLTPARPKAARTRRSELERELAAYSTPAQRRDLEAILDRYPDGITHELREILASQEIAVHNNRFPAVGRH